MQGGAWRRCHSPGAESRGATQQQQVIISHFAVSKEDEIFHEKCAPAGEMSCL